MTSVVEAFRKVSVEGDVKLILIQTNSACDTGHTLDLGSDTFAGAGITTIHNILIQDDAGADEETTFDPDTGIITMGTLAATGIHNMTVIGY